ncbi:mitochondrial distribution and morphology protein-domain-containing protein [Kalaharituber pfeilii]|nr:mitochondrial distribution and morphology protein-domain-containing protein [Kalaharituber pfeilii]
MSSAALRKFRGALPDIAASFASASGRGFGRHWRTPYQVLGVLTRQHQAHSVFHLSRPLRLLQRSWSLHTGDGWPTAAVRFSPILLTSVASLRTFQTRSFAFQGTLNHSTPASRIVLTPPPALTANAVVSAAKDESGACTQCGRSHDLHRKNIELGKRLLGALANGTLKYTPRSRLASLPPGRRGIQPTRRSRLSAPARNSAAGDGPGANLPRPPGGSSSNGSGGSHNGRGDGNGVPGGSNGGRRGNGRPNGKTNLNTTAETNSTTSNPDSGILGRIAQIHRPTKDQMLAAATSMFARFRIRAKWALIRQMRPYNLEEILALLQWLVVGHIIWIVLGTTTFFSIVILLANTVYAQENLASLVGNYLTGETGVRVVFESAIVPRWKDGRISFKNVFASRRPGNLRDKSKRNVQKGSSATAAAVAAAAQNAEKGKPPGEDEDEDTNYTQFDVTIDEIAVTLSFARWMNGKGLLKDVEVKGVRGVVDRTHVRWEEGVDPRSYKYVHQPGDFAIESFKLEDLLVTVYQPDGFRPFSISIFNCDLPQLRKQWLFYDFLSANNVSGSYDDSLFTIHPRQSHGISPSQQLLSDNNGSGSKLTWKKMSRLRIDGLAIDHLNCGVEGPFGWIERGHVDIVADILFPEDTDELAFGKVVQEIVDLNYPAATPPPPSIRLPPPLSGSPPGYISSPTSSTQTAIDINDPFIVLDLHLQLQSVRAAVPLFTKDLSYVNSALIRPIVAYINSRHTYIPINCRVIKRTSEFDGSWTIYDSGLMDDLSAEMYEAFAAHVMDRQARRRRFRKVGLWSLQLLAQALLMAMAGNLA